VQKQFAEKFPETPLPHRIAVLRLIEKFRKTGSVLDKTKWGTKQNKHITSRTSESVCE
jgi:hypothetical protein